MTSFWVHPSGLETPWITIRGSHTNFQQGKQGGLSGPSRTWTLQVHRWPMNLGLVYTLTWLCRRRCLYWCWWCSCHWWSYSLCKVCPSSSRSALSLLPSCRCELTANFLNAASSCSMSVLSAMMGKPATQSQQRRVRLNEQGGLTEPRPGSVHGPGPEPELDSR